LRETKKFVLIGHSMGGKIALALAARRPANLDSLILLAPSPPTPEPISDSERKRLLAGHGDRAAAEETLNKITAHTLPTQTFERCIEDALRCSPLAWRAWLEDGSREDISHDVRRIDVPVVVVAGELDEPLNASLLKREIVERIGNARLTTLPDAKHLFPLEESAKVAELINQHCQRSSTKTQT
jgi:pimeloyl-ACP methyl ester carboxylesterase